MSSKVAEIASVLVMMKHRVRYGSFLQRSAAQIYYSGLSTQVAEFFFPHLQGLQVALLELEEKKKKILVRNDAGISVRWIQLMVIVYLLHNI